MRTEKSFSSILDVNGKKVTLFAVIAVPEALDIAGNKYDLRKNEFVKIKYKPINNKHSVIIVPQNNFKTVLFISSIHPSQYYNLII